MKNHNKQLFEIIEAIGEGVHGPLHIIDMSERIEPNESYRCYHANGHCFDVLKEDLEDERQGIDFTVYHFTADQFEGFEDISVEDAILLAQHVYNPEKFKKTVDTLIDKGAIFTEEKAFGDRMRETSGKLIEGNKILLHDKSYDGHGWEFLNKAIEEGEKVIEDLKSKHRPNQKRMNK